MNKARMNICVQIFVCVCEHENLFNWDKCPKVQLLDCMAAACLVFYKKLPNCVAECLQRFAFPPAMHKQFRFSTSLPALSVVTIYLF